MSSELLGEQIIYACGFGPTLLLGGEDEALLFELTNRGVQAWMLEGTEEKFESINSRMPGRYFLQTLLDADLEVLPRLNVFWRIDFSKLGKKEIRAYLKRLRDLSVKSIYLVATNLNKPVIGSKTWKGALEFAKQAFVQSGFRKSPLYQRVAPFSQLEFENHEVVVFQRIPTEGLEFVPLKELYAERRNSFDDSPDVDLGVSIRERDIHMDMLREMGRRSDAHVARYEFAQGFVRPHDLILEAGSGLGYGSSVLYEGTYCSKVLGIDSSAFAVEYSKRNYGQQGAIQFIHRSLTSKLPFKGPEVDFCVAFEIIEHLKDPRVFLKDLHRVLKPGGKFILSVPNMWVDETGKDPWLFHEDCYDLEKIRELVSEYFLIDKLYFQSAGGTGHRFASKRVLDEWNMDSINSISESEVEWWIVSAVKSPLKPGRSEYRETVLAQKEKGVHNSHSFRRDYGNPWIAHSLIHGNLRVRSQQLLRELVESVSSGSKKDSADLGGALCVRAYQMYGASTIDKAYLFEEIDRYLGQSSKNPHVLRWKISLIFVKALLLQASGDFAEAVEVYKECASYNALKFSPHLCTKTTEAAYFAGMLLSAAGEDSQAEKMWKRGMQIGAQLLRSNWTDVIVNREAPNRFGVGDGLRETMVAIDNVARCANGLHYLKYGRKRVGLRLGVEDSFKTIAKRERISQISLAVEGQAKERNYHWALSAERKKDELSIKTKELTSQLVSLEQGTSALLEEKGDLEKQNASLEMVVEGSHSEIAALKTQLEKISESLSEKLDLISEKDSQLEQLSRTSTNLESRLQAVLEEKESIREKRDLFLEEVNGLRTNLQMLKQQFDSELEEKEKTQTELSERQKELMLLTDKLIGIEGKLRSTTSDLEKKEERLDEILAKLESEIQKRENVEATLSKKLGEIDTLESRLSRTTEKLEATRVELETSIETYDQKIKGLKRTGKKLEKSLRGEIHTLEEEKTELIADWNAKKKGYEERLDYYDDRLAESRLQIKKNKSKIRSLDKNISGLTKDRDQIRQHLEQTTEDLKVQCEKTWVEEGKVNSLKDNLLQFYIEKSDRVFLSEILEEKLRLKWRGNSSLGLFIRCANSIIRGFRRVYCFLRRKPFAPNAEIIRLAQINTHDLIGGAERSSYDLHTYYRNVPGIDPSLMVGGKYSDDPDVFKVEYTKRDWKWAETWRDKWGFTEAFYPTPFKGCFKWDHLRNADVVHIHNMHGQFWSTGTVPLLSFQHPMVFTLHDEYTLSGDCCYTYDCDRWRNSCGKCPQIGLTRNQRYSLGERDKTRFNVLLKRLIFRFPSVYPQVIVTPTRWLSERARRSKNLRHLPIVTIPNGVDIEKWIPVDQHQSRINQNFPTDKTIALVVASDLGDRRKGFKWVIEALKLLPENHKLFFVVVGSISEELHKLTREFPIHATGYVKDKSQMIELFGASDFTLAMSQVDNLPYMCLESLACGRPVFGSDAGGIPEIISDTNLGWLEPLPLNPEQIAARLCQIDIEMQSDQKFERFERCRSSAVARYSIKLMAKRYARIYDELVDSVRQKRALNLVNFHDSHN